MSSRLRNWFWAMFISVDCVIGTWIRGWWYVWLGGEEPNPRETISGWTGRRAAQGRRWALQAELLIDGWFYPGHCRDAAKRERSLYCISQSCALRDRERSVDCR